MNEKPDDGPGPAGADGRPAADREEFERLRRILLAGDRDRLESVERRLSDPDVRAEELSHVLPESLARAAHHSNRLGLALAGVLDEALAASIKKNRRELAAALSPAMGPAIRRAIGETLRTMVDSFNQVLQHGLSLNALRWRLEAWRTGRPFAEVVLTHSLVYRVEQVFLVHRQSGLLLQHVTAGAAGVRDGDLVSGMLTAIQDFVRDSFAVDAEQAVDTMRVGDLAVWVEQGEEAYLAAVVRGSAPVQLRSVMRDALETIHLELGEAFDTFAGDATPFEEGRHHLEGCLQMQVAGTGGRSRWLAPAIVGGVAVLLLGVWLALAAFAGARWGAYLARLRAEPGIVIVSERAGVFRSSISGLVDRYAADPVKLLAGPGLDARRVASRWEPYVSEHPAIVLARAKGVLSPPASATLSFADGTLSAGGSAPHDWVTAARSRAMTVPGVLRFATDQLTDEGLAALRPVSERLGAIALRFDVGVAELPSREHSLLDEAAAVLQELATVARDSGVAVRVDVVGHTDGTGSESTNVRLSRARAEWVLSALEARGVRDLTLAILGVGASRPLRPEDTAEGRGHNRSVTFEVTAAP